MFSLLTLLASLFIELIVKFGTNFSKLKHFTAIAPSKQQPFEDSLEGFGDITLLVLNSELLELHKQLAN